MFCSKRYITKGIQDTVSMELQMYLWGLIDSREDERLDYLQIFELRAKRFSNGMFIQNIIYRQEVPIYHAEYQIIAKDAINAKIYVIDDGDYCTMLLSEEY